VGPYSSEASEAPVIEEQDKVLRSYFARKGGARSQGGEGGEGTTAV